MGKRHGEPGGYDVGLQTGGAWVRFLMPPKTKGSARGVCARKIRSTERPVDINLP